MPLIPSARRCPFASSTARWPKTIFTNIQPTTSQRISVIAKATGLTSASGSIANIPSFNAPTITATTGMAMAAVTSAPPMRRAPTVIAKPPATSINMMSGPISSSGMSISRGLAMRSRLRSCICCVVGNGLGPCWASWHWILALCNALPPPRPRQCRDAGYGSVAAISAHTCLLSLFLGHRGAGS